MNKTLTTGDIARYCQVNFRTVIRWIERGLLKAHKLPGRGDNRVKPEDFVAFLQANNMPIPQELLEIGRRVLIVEDDEVMARLIEKTLHKAGYDTRIAPTGFHAGIEVSEFAPTLVTLDLEIPGLGGLEVLEDMRRTSSLSHIKVLVVSGLTRAELDRALAAGADDILEKPLQPGVLLKKVRELIS
ncbi:MAG: response regulator [Gammaproteobacteria bacterium]|nr:MAG: response regulator [Gammaproteobacteria bacterium]